jgi:hypothetical protein
MALNTNWSGDQTANSQGRFRPFSDDNPRPQPKKIETSETKVEGDPITHKRIERILW